MIARERRVIRMSYVIEVKNFTKSYGKMTAVDNVSFNVKRGSIFAFLGPNGAGKSTTINTLCTILNKTSGSLKIDGQEVDSNKDYVRSVIGVVFQDETLDEKMSVEENLRMHCIFYNIPSSLITDRINFALNLVDLKDRKKAMVNSLSGGMKRRVEIARSLLHFPKVLFLDEPTTGLDPQTRKNIWDYIIKLQQEKGITIFLTTHYMDEAEISDHVAVMDYGKIIAFDRPSVLKNKYTKDIASVTSTDVEQLEKTLVKHQLTYEKNENTFKVEITNLSLFTEIISEHRQIISDLEIKKGTLNDVFLEITGKDIRG